MREFISQVLVDIVRNLKQTSGVVQIVHELLEVNLIYLVIDM